MHLLSPSALLFDEVARAGSIRGAAERLNVSASAVNRRILNLEAEVGMPLFERLARGVRLTAAGETLVFEIRRWRREQESTGEQLLELRGLKRGRVAIGVMECFAAELVPRLVAAMRDRHPRVSVDVIVGGTDEVLARVAAEEIDIALLFNAARRDKLRTVRSATITPGLAMAPNHPLAGRPTLRLADCVSYPFVLPDRSLGLRTVIDASFARLRLEPLSVVATNSIALMKALIGDGHHLALLNALDLQADVAAGRFRFTAVEDRLLAEDLARRAP